MKSIEQYSDADIIQKILGGEIALFEILVRRNNAYLYKVGRSYNYGHEDTQDLMQDTFVDAYKNLTKFQHRASFKTWIIKIMLNNCYQRKQKFSVKNETSVEIQDHSEPMFSANLQTEPGHYMQNKELRSVIEKALQNIPLDYRIVFSLREVNGLNVEETAEVLDISQSNVKVRLNRAKMLLRKEVEKSYTAEDIFEFNLVYCEAMVQGVMHRINELNRIA